MNAKEAMVRSMETQKRLVQEQLKDVHKLIKEAVDEGNFNTRAHSHRLSSTISVGWLDEVVEELRGEGYTVQLTDGTIIVSWGEVGEEPKPPSLEVTKDGIPPRPYKDPHMIKEDGGGIVAMVLTGLVISGLILLGLMFG